MKITRKWLNDFTTFRGGYTRAQTTLLGVRWPLKSGWKIALIGREIPDATAREFERIACKRRADVMATLLADEFPWKTE